MRHAGRSRVAGILRMVPFAAAIIACSVWALAPLEGGNEPTVEVPVLPAAVPRERPEPARLDLAAFRAPLWVAPPAPPPPPKADPPPPPRPPPAPLKLQLLAIVREAEVLKAVLYDPDTDRLIVAADGEELGAHRVERVRETAVDIREERGLRTLSLADAQSGGGR